MISAKRQSKLKFDSHYKKKECLWFYLSMVKPLKAGNTAEAGILDSCIEWNERTKYY